MEDIFCCMRDRMSPDRLVSSSLHYLTNLQFRGRLAVRAEHETLRVPLCVTPSLYGRSNLRPNLRGDTSLLEGTHETVAAVSNTSG